MSKGHILLVDDDVFFRECLRDVLADQGYRVSEVGDGTAALDLAEHNGGFDVMLLDLELPRLNGMQVLQQLCGTCPALPVIIITGTGDVPKAVQAIQLGAFDFIEKDDDPQKTLIKVRNAIEKSRLMRDRHEYISDQKERYKMVGSSLAMQKIYNLIDKAANKDSKVLITGESGTGKELIARAIHMNSCRAGGRFVAVNCAAIPENLIESELFGYEKGAFTGAAVRKKGKFELADHGTLFLDEIGDTSLMMQAKILRAIEDGFIERLGSEKPTEVDLRLIAATHRNLEHEMQEGNFRSDLFWRLSVIQIELPTLAQRKEDIPLLVEHFFKRFSDGKSTFRRRFSQAAMNVMLSYDWPGNVRQLRNVVEKLLVLHETGIIVAEHVVHALKMSDTMIDKNFSLLKVAREQFEKEYIQHMLTSHQWNIQDTAVTLRIDRTHL